MTFISQTYKREQYYKTAILILLGLVLAISILCLFLGHQQSKIQKDYNFLSAKFNELYAEYEDIACVMSLEEAIGMSTLEPIEELNEENLNYWLLMLNAKHIDVLLCNAKLESHIGKSNLGGKKLKKNANVIIWHM